MLMVDLVCYNCYHSQALNGVLERTLSLQMGGLRNSTSVGERNHYITDTFANDIT